MLSAQLPARRTLAAAAQRMGLQVKLAFAGLTTQAAILRHLAVFAVPEGHSSS